MAELSDLRSERLCRQPQTTHQDPGGGQQQDSWGQSIVRTEPPL